MTAESSARTLRWSRYYRHWNYREPGRLRVSSLRFMHRSHHLREIADRLARRWRNLPPGVHLTLAGVPGTIRGTPRFIAGELVMERELRMGFDVHQATTRSVTHPAPRDGWPSDKWEWREGRPVFYMDGVLIVPRDEGEYNVLLRLHRNMCITEQVDWRGEWSLVEMYYRDTYNHRPVRRLFSNERTPAVW